MAKERPILFSDPMSLRAMLGQKTQTRRIVTTPGVGFIGSSAPGDWDDPACWGFEVDDDAEGLTRWYVLARGLDEHHHHGQVSIRCPYGEPGDRLWVREAWALATGSPPDRAAVVRYRAGGDLRSVTVPDGGKIPANASTSDRWRPSIHMPRWASRTALELTDVRVQRLHAITLADIIAEGIDVPPVDYTVADDPRALDHEREMWARRKFSDLWESINGAGAWKANPWVWALSFKLVEPSP